eukprot:114215_1
MCTKMCLNTIIAFTLLCSFKTIQSTTITLWNHILPFKMNSFASGVYNNEVTIFGGYKDGTLDQLKDSWSSSDVNIPWISHSQRNPFNAERIMFISTCVQIPNSPLIYSVPRKINVNSTDIREGQHLLIYNLSNHSYIDTSTYQSVLPHPTSYSCSVIENNNLYVIGGQYNDIITELVQVYDILMDNWSNRSSINGGKTGPGCIMHSVSNQIFLFGGRMESNNGTTYETGSIEKYNISNDQWTEINAKLVVPRSHLKCNLFHNYVLCVGGTDWSQGNSFPKLIEVFNPINERIVSLEWNLYLHFDRYYHQTVIYNDSLLVLGGRNVTYRWDTIERIVYNDFVSSGSPTKEPTEYPTNPSVSPTFNPSDMPSDSPSKYPTFNPSQFPSISPTFNPSISPTFNPSDMPSDSPSKYPTFNPSQFPSISPTFNPSVSPTFNPSEMPSDSPSISPTL